MFAFCRAHRWDPSSDEYGRSARACQSASSTRAKGRGASTSSGLATGSVCGGGDGTSGREGAAESDFQDESGEKEEEEEEEEDAGDAHLRGLSNSVSLFVTADHRMLLRRGRASLTDSGKTEIAWDDEVDVDKVPDPASPAQQHSKSSAVLLDPYEVVLAGSLLSSRDDDGGGKDGKDAVKLRACAPGGTAVDSEEDDLPPFEALRLRSAAQRNAFLEVYGFWLGDGELQFKRGIATKQGAADAGDGRDEVAFCTVKQADKAWLLAQFAAVDLQESRDFSVGEASSSAANLITVRIFDEAWVKLFFDEYALKYRSASDSSSSIYWSGGGAAGNAGGNTTAMPDADAGGGGGGGVGEGSSGAVPLCTRDIVSSAAGSSTDSEDVKSAKSLAYWAWRLSRQQAGFVLAGLRRADGEETSGDEPSVYASSVRFRDELVRLALHAGCSPTFRIKYDAGESRGVDRGGKVIKANHACWKVTYTPSTPNSQYAEPVLMQQRDVRAVPYTGRTWCVTVPNGFVVARRVHVRASDGVVTKASRPLVVGNCPGGPDSDFEYSTQAYTGYEPTSMRAIRARYDPFAQTRGRVAQLRSLGHSVDKVEFIVMGGTFMSLDKEYKDYFIRNLHDALSGHRSHTVAEAITFSEQSATKCVGITIETRPDYCLKPHLAEMLGYGCTRIEIGVQSIYESVARETNRGHTVASVCASFHLAKDCGFKVVSHMMPDLPNCDFERDLEGFKEYFENPMFRSDGLKLYPTLVIRGTGLYELWRTGRYRNYTPEQLVELIAAVLSLVPPWTRVYRIQRDIPMPLVTSGVENGNLRELALARMSDLGMACKDIRSREVGMKEIHEKIKPDNVELVRRDYVANGGWETFLAYEDPRQDILIGLLRLRRASPTAFRQEMVGKRCSIVRELHVYGTAVGVSARDPTKFQHQGFGMLLMEEAERIAREEHGSEKILVISGVGTRHYYRKMGYELDGVYMSKML